MSAGLNLVVVISLYINILYLFCKRMYAMSAKNIPRRPAILVPRFNLYVTFKLIRSPRSINQKTKQTKKINNENLHLLLNNIKYGFIRTMYTTTIFHI